MPQPQFANTFQIANVMITYRTVYSALQHCVPSVSDLWSHAKGQQV